MRGEVLAHRALGVGGLAADEERERLRVAALARRLRRRRRTRGLGRRARLGEALFQEQAHGGAGVGEGERGVPGQGGAELLERVGAPPQETLDAARVALERGDAGRGHREPVGVVAHDGHPSANYSRTAAEGAGRVAPPDSRDDRA